MKVNFTNHIKTKSGKCDDGCSVFVARKDRSIAIMRKHRAPRQTQAHIIAAAEKLSAAAKLWHSVSEPFKADLARYANAYNLQHQSAEKLDISGYNVFTMVVCKRSTPFIGLAQVSDELGSSVDEWIDGNFLKRVNITTSFTANIA